MENLESPRRCKPARRIAWMLAASVLWLDAGAAELGAHWQASYPSLANGKAGEAAAVPIAGPSHLVTVVIPGANPQEALLRSGTRSVPAHVVGYDPVSRLGFLQVDGPSSPQAAAWLEDAGACLGKPLRAITPGGSSKCIATGWVKQVGGKILPLALLRVNFDQAVPLPGTPLVDSSGRVAAIVFQSSGSGGIGYAIPAEAVHRVRRDVAKGGNLVRGWLGLSLNAESPSPRVVRVLPDSPAAEAGILPADVLISIGARQVSDYADAANAFFYLVPGQETRVKVRRGSRLLEFQITPTRPRAE